MCQTSKRKDMLVKRPIIMGKIKDVNSNFVDAGKAHSGKYKELTTIGNAEVCSKFVRYFSVLTIAAMVFYIRLCGRPQENDCMKHVNFMHLLTFASHFGAQFWVTFIAGFTMFFNLPRIMFGRLQSRLFPIYFGTTLLLSCVTFVTFTIRHPFDAMTSEAKFQLLVLGICVLTTFINSFFIAPEIVSSMVNVFGMEKDSGVAFAVGYCDRSELKKDPVYCKYYKQFRRVHGVSGATNLMTLVCNVIYLYHLANV